MSTVRVNVARPSRGSRAFTLIELLVVIAIIALLAAILFPVFASVREKARQTTAISNLHQIQLGMGAYQLDYHKYPDVLFGYVDGTNPMSTAYSTTGNPNGLYPRYVKDYHVFLDPNNNADPTSASALASNIPVLKLDPTGKLIADTKNFYSADAYDLSPEVTGTNAVAAGTLVPRYQLNWTSITGNTPPPALSPSYFYQKQLRWKTVPGDTYVTCTTYHVQNANKVIILYESGTAKTIDSSKFTGDVPALSPSNDVSNAKFWQVHP